MYMVTGEQAERETKGVLHNALDDCDMQIAHLANAMKLLNIISSVEETANEPS
jgi:hypothetical protein